MGLDSEGSKTNGFWTDETVGVKEDEGLVWKGGRGVEVVGLGWSPERTGVDESCGGGTGRSPQYRVGETRRRSGGELVRSSHGEKTRGLRCPSGDRRALGRKGLTERISHRPRGSCPVPRCV